MAWAFDEDQNEIEVIFSEITSYETYDVAFFINIGDSIRFRLTTLMRLSDGQATMKLI